MHISIQGVHYHVSDNTKEFIDKKLQKLEFMKEDIMDFQLTIKKEPHHDSYSIDANVKFKWGTSAPIRVDSYELWEGLETLFAKVQMKARKEKEKVKKH